MNRQTNIQKYKKMDSKTGGQTDGKTLQGQINRHPENDHTQRVKQPQSQKDRQTHLDRHKDIQRHTHTEKEREKDIQSNKYND